MSTTNYWRSAKLRNSANPDQNSRNLGIIRYLAEVGLIKRRSFGAVVPLLEVSS